MSRFTLWKVLPVLACVAGALAADDKLVPTTSVANADLAAWVDKRIKERQPGPNDRRFDEVGWVKDIREAQKLAKDHKRPVFLFTHDGRMNVGRC
jgi:hypothetical protein